MCSQVANSSKRSISSTAIIPECIKIGNNVFIGEYVVVGENVTIGDNTSIGSHCVIGSNVEIGNNNIFHPFSSIGGASQSKGGSLEKGGRLVIGNNNVVHEYCTINIGSLADGEVTNIGNDNIFMAYVHVGHDCQIANNVILVNNTTLAGHVRVNEGAILGAFTTVRQFSTIGAYSFATESAALSKDVLPYIRVRRSPAVALGVNLIGLNRNNFSTEQIKIISEAYRVIFRRGNTVQEAIDWLEQYEKEYSCLTPMREMLQLSEQGVVR